MARSALYNLMKEPAFRAELAQARKADLQALLMDVYV
jgi:hypothetical protein